TTSATSPSTRTGPRSVPAAPHKPSPRYATSSSASSASPDTPTWPSPAESAATTTPSSSGCSTYCQTPPKWDIHQTCRGRAPVPVRWASLFHSTKDNNHAMEERKLCAFTNDLLALEPVPVKHRLHGGQRQRSRPMAANRKHHSSTISHPWGSYD